jgi:hypothetical protein
VKSKSLLPLHSFVSNVARNVDVVGWLWRLCVSFSSIILLGWEAFKDFSSATRDTISTLALCIGVRLEPMLRLLLRAAPQRTSR